MAGDTAHHDGPEHRSTVVLDVSGLRWASEQNVIARRLGRRPGVLDVEVNPVAQTATVTFDPSRTSLIQLRRWVIECGYHCAGQSVPAHICDPMTEPDPAGDVIAIEDGPDDPETPDHHAVPQGHTAATGRRANQRPIATRAPR